MPEFRDVGISETVAKLKKHGITPADQRQYRQGLIQTRELLKRCRREPESLRGPWHT